MYQNNKESFEKTGLRILAIGSDETALMPGKAVQGDTIQRNQEYGKVLESLHIVVFTRDKTIPSQVKLSNNVFSYSTRSKNKLSFFMDALRIASAIQERENCNRYKYGVPGIGDMANLMASQGGC